MIPNNNPTANIGLRREKRNLSTIKPSYTDIADLEILCNHCTSFDKEGNIQKVIMRHDTRNELYACDRCPRVVSEKQVRYVMRLELPEFYNYEKVTSKENVDDVNKERQAHEKFVIRAINSESPSDLIKRTGVKVVKNKKNY